MRLFVGLGNPGAKYAHNRHNVGFMAVDEIARRHGFAPWRRRFQGETFGRHARSREGCPASPGDVHERVRPCGSGSREFLQARRGRDHRVSGRTRTACRPRCASRLAAASPATTGLRSISAHIGNDYRRVRLGIGHPGIKELVHGYVLSDFAKDDRPWVEALVRGDCRQRRPARHRQGFDVPEQGASGDAGQGIFRQG